MKYNSLYEFGENCTCILDYCIIDSALYYSVGKVISVQDL